MGRGGCILKEERVERERETLMKRKDVSSLSLFGFKEMH